MKVYFSILLPLLGFDAFWLLFLAKNFYRKHLGYLFAENFSLWPAAVFYLVYALGLAVFAVNPALDEKSLWAALWRGALLGLVAYATYDLTNQATIAKWPIAVTVADLIWGIFISAAVCALAYLIASKLG